MKALPPWAESLCWTWIWEKAARRWTPTCLCLLHYACTLHHQFNDMIVGKLAYRWLDMDYDDDSFAMEMLASCPMLGTSFEW